MADRRRTRSAFASVDPRQTEGDCAAVLGGLGKYAERFWPILNPDDPFVGGYAFDCVAEHYEEWMDPDGSIQNLIVNQPFRTGKSTNLVFAMTYRWLFAPSTCWMFATYNHRLSVRDSVACRDLIQHPRYQAVLKTFGQSLHLKSDQNTQMAYVNNHKGFRMALTVGKGLGEGAHYLVVDDPIDPKLARSKKQREACIDWWRSTYRHRIKGDPRKVRRLVVQQRINQADLTGYLRENEGDDWECLVLPMRYEPTRMIFGPTLAKAEAETETKGEALELAKHLLGGPKVSDPIRPTSLQDRKPRLRDAAEGSGRKAAGDLLWPERFTEKIVREFERTLGRDAPGQLQQRPSSATGNVFRVDKAGVGIGRFDDVGRLALIDLLKADGTVVSYTADRWRWFQVMDTATKTSEENSYTVIGTFGLADDGMLLLWHIFRERLEVPDLYPTIKLLRRGPAVWDDEKRAAQGQGKWPGPLIVRYVEPKSSGLGLIQTSVIDGEPIMPLANVPGDKLDRSGHTAALYESGCVFHRPGPWLSTAVEELRLFPNADFDDVADVMSYAGHVAATDKLLRVHINRRLILNLRGEESRRAAAEVLPQEEIDRIAEGK
mgnify:CR=1 FL=1